MSNPKFTLTFQYFLCILFTQMPRILSVILLAPCLAFAQTSYVQQGGSWVGSDGSSFTQRGSAVVTNQGSYVPRGGAVVAPNGQGWVNQGGAWVNGQQSVRQVGGAWVNQDNKACVQRGGAWVCDK